MNRLFLMLILLNMFLFVGCEDKTDTVKIDSNAQSSAAMKEIKVVEHMNAAGYTYILANENGNEYWIAIAQMPVDEGETLYYTQSMEMKNFTSKALDRTFDSILFVEGVSKDGKTTQKTRNSMMGSNPHSGVSNAEKADVDIEPLKDGISVKELYADKQNYSGKIVRMKGVVTKFNGSIMNRNWIHIQDGTSYNNYNDITVTSDQKTKVGETIIIEGKLVLDKDFGSGYRYDAIIEEAKIIKE